MSYHVWSTNGYGISMDDIGEPSVERLEKLLECAPVFREEIRSWLRDAEIEHPAISDYKDYDEDTHMGIAYILQQVIQEAEPGIELTACDDFDGEKFLLLESRSPWNLSERERTITQDEMTAIFEKYTAILTDTAVLVQYQSVENGG